MAEGPVTKKPQPYNDPNWFFKLSKDQQDAVTGPRYNKHPQYSKHEKKLISKMSNAEKADKGWRNPNVDEGTGNIGAGIKSLFQKIYDQGDDEIEYFYYESPVFAQYWDQYEGDIDSIIAEVDPAELQIIHDELEAYVEGAGLMEVSDATLTSYLTKVDADSQKHDRDPTKRSPAKRNKSVAGFARAFNKLDARREKTDEVSKDTLGSYVKKAHQDVVDRATSASFQSGQAGDKYNKADTSPKDQQREKGMSRALDRLTRESDSKQPQEADYGDDYQDMVKRVKKLAGLGPLKTVWDPVKRVYRNVPVSTQPK